MFNKKSKYKLTRHGFNKRKSGSVYYELAKDYDNHGYISNQLGKELQSLYEDDYFIGIHRTAYTDIQEIFNNGLKNNGSTAQGAASNGINALEKTVTSLSNIVLLIGQLKAACHYRDYYGNNAHGSFIVKIPKSYLGLEEGEIKPIYYYDGYEQRLLPEFIYGYIPVKDEICGDIVRNPNYSDTHSYDEEGLSYEPDAMIKLNSGKSI